MSVKIVTDSTSDLSPEIAKSLGITIVPLNVHFGEQTYLDGIEITPDEFFHRLTTEKNLPKTSQPSIGAFTEAYKSVIGTDVEILSIHVSEKLSGTINSARGAIEQLPEAKIELVDTMGVSLFSGLVVMEAARAAIQGASLEEVKQVALAAIDRARVYVVLDTLEYLQKGGRIGKASALVGGLLSVKPVLTVKDGEVHPFEKVRSRAKALQRIREIVEEGGPYVEIQVLYSTNTEEASLLANDLQKHTPDSKILMVRVGPVIGTYAGPGAVGVALLKP
jgi:DegV family protein with EDD domain